MRCRFEPSCSHYAMEAVSHHGIIKGGADGASSACCAAIPWPRRLGAIPFHTYIRNKRHMIRLTKPDYKRIFLAIFLAAVLLIGWQIKVEWPRRQALAHLNAQQAKQREASQANTGRRTAAKEAEAEENPIADPRAAPRRYRRA